jgi:hypothetical protein
MGSWANLYCKAYIPLGAQTPGHRCQASSRAPDTFNPRLLSYHLPSSANDPDLLQYMPPDVEGYRPTQNIKQSIKPDASILVRRISGIVGKKYLYSNMGALQASLSSLVSCLTTPFKSWMLYPLNGNTTSSIRLEIESLSKSQALLDLPRLNVCKAVCRHFPHDGPIDSVIVL